MPGDDRRRSAAPGGATERRHVAIRRRPGAACWLTAVLVACLGAGLLTGIAEAASAGATSPLLFISDFGNDATDVAVHAAGWVLQAPNNAAITLSSEVARTGSKSLKFDFNYDDWNGSDIVHGVRTEILLPPRKVDYALDETFWTGFSEFVPTSWVDDYPDNGEILWQFHSVKDGPGAGRGPPLSFDVAGGTAYIRVRASEHGPAEAIASMAFDEMKGRWVDWVIETRFSYATGLIRVWRDGAKIVDYRGPTIYRSEHQTNQHGLYLKLGIYKRKWGSVPTRVSNRTLYVDDVRIGSAAAGCAAVAPPGATACSKN